MPGWTDYWENAILNYTFRGTAMPALTDLHFALFTTLPDDAGAGGVEASATGYARAQVTRVGGNWKDPAIATQGDTLNLIKIVWPVQNAAIGSVVGFGAFDAAGGGNLLFTVDSADVTVDTLGQPYIEINAFTFTQG